ncbi:MAG: hypothetical protein J6A04_04665 [Clostridia bacterium]|nr:hypothetical protein [Clostridia bacterium]
MAAIEKAAVSTISISGEKNAAMVAQYIQIKDSASRCKGKILREQEFDDGYFLEVFFPKEELKHIYENSIGITK